MSLSMVKGCHQRNEKHKENQEDLKIWPAEEQNR